MRSFTLLLFFSFILSSCGDNGCKPIKPENEESQITTYAAANNITATKHSSGMYYQIINPGSGIAPTVNSKVYVTYVGKRLDGSIFDQHNTPVMFAGLNGLIEGWQVGLQLIKKGGEIKLIVPSSMAYGCTGSKDIIAPNSVLYFDIQLIDVQ